MSTLFSRLTGCLALAVLLVFLSSSASVTAATYTVGGAGANYATLEALRTSGVLRDGDTIILNVVEKTILCRILRENILKEGFLVLQSRHLYGRIQLIGKPTCKRAEQCPHNKFH